MGHAKEALFITITIVWQKTAKSSTKITHVENVESSMSSSIANVFSKSNSSDTASKENTSVQQLLNVKRSRYNSVSMSIKITQHNA